MAQKALESAVRDLVKSVCELTKKVSDLECKTAEQSSIISVQTDTIAQLKTAVEGTSTCTCRNMKVPNTTSTTTQPQPTTGAEPALQRPVRQARVNATQKTALTAAGKSNPSIDSPLSSQPDFARLDTKRIVPSPSNTATKARQATKMADPDLTTTDTCVAIKQAAVTGGSDNSTAIQEIQESANWTIVSHKRQTKRKIVSGVREDDTELQTVERHKHLQAWSFSPETSAQNILDYLNKILPCKDYTVIKRDIKTTKHSAFIIGFPESLYEQLCLPSSWPQRVKVSDWFLRRPRSQRGNTSPAPIAHADATSSSSAVATSRI